MRPFWADLPLNTFTTQRSNRDAQKRRPAMLLAARTLPNQENEGSKGVASRERPLPRTVGRYIVVHLVGTGGMGASYEAYDPNLGRKVALKVLHSASATDSSSISCTRALADRARSLREAKNLARLAHPNVVPISDVGTLGDAEAAFVAMEFIEDDSLRRVFEEEHATISSIQ